MRLPLLGRVRQICLCLLRSSEKHLAAQFLHGSCWCLLDDWNHMIDLCVSLNVFCGFAHVSKRWSRHYTKSSSVKYENTINSRTVATDQTDVQQVMSHKCPRGLSTTRAINPLFSAALWLRLAFEHEVERFSIR